ncbi:MAG: hypothetical protein WCV73_02400 [Patescibacteria group bacterium]
MAKDKRTYRDRAEYLKKAVDKRRKSLRLMAVRYKGGKCQLCGYKKCIQALDFHHLDPKKKDFGISESGTTRSWMKIKTELDKCLMICANCHREVHHGKTQLFAVRQIEK